MWIGFDRSQPYGNRFQRARMFWKGETFIFKYIVEKKYDLDCDHVHMAQTCRKKLKLLYLQYNTIITCKMLQSLAAYHKHVK